MTYLIIEPVLI
jgi:hypothetical protein